MNANENKDKSTRGEVTTKAVAGMTLRYNDDPRTDRVLTERDGRLGMENSAREWMPIGHFNLQLWEVVNER